MFEHGEELKKIGLDVPECAKLAAILREKGFDIVPGTFRREDMCREILKNLKK